MVTFVILVFLIGYLAIALEHPIKINKTASALLTGVICWTLYAMFTQDSIDHIGEQLNHHLGQISAILFFLMGAMTIVEIIDYFDGF